MSQLSHILLHKPVIPLPLISLRILPSQIKDLRSSKYYSQNQRSQA